MEILEYTALKSAAGWYVGRMCITEMGMEPYDRVSPYYKTKELALEQVKYYAQENAEEVEDYQEPLSAQEQVALFAFNKLVLNK